MYLDSFLLWGPVSHSDPRAYPRRPLGPPDKCPEDAHVTSRATSDSIDSMQLACAVGPLESYPSALEPGVALMATVPAAV